MSRNIDNNRKKSITARFKSLSLTKKLLFFSECFLFLSLLTISVYSYVFISISLPKDIHSEFTINKFVNKEDEEKMPWDYLWWQVETASKKPRLRTGSLAFHAPKTIHYDETKKIQLIVSPDLLRSDLIELLQVDGNDLIQVESAEIQITQTVEARLLSKSFDIMCLDSETQDKIFENDKTEWFWEINPKNKVYGLRKLNLTVSSVFKNDRKRTIDHFSKDIYVVIAPHERSWRFIKDHWAAIIPIIIGILGLPFIPSILRKFLR